MMKYSIGQFPLNISNRLSLLCLIPLLCMPVHAEEPLTTAQAMSIAYQVGWKMKEAGFDRAENVRALPELPFSYISETDTVTLSTDDDEEIVAIEMRKLYLSVPWRERLTAIAAHEQCHAYLVKHRHQLPDAVAQAATACQIFPEASSGRMFDEVFCDIAAVNVIGKSAEIVFTAMRADSDNGDKTDSLRYMHHSYPVFRDALIANNKKENNLVTQTAKALQAACDLPETKAFVGTQEKIYGEKLTADFLDFMNIPAGKFPPIQIKPFKQLSLADRKRLKMMREEVGEAPLQGFLAVNNACIQFMSHPGLPASTYVTRAIERCKLTKEQFEQAYCTSVASEITPRVMPHGKNSDEEYIKISNFEFGKNSFSSRLLLDQMTYQLPVYATGKKGDPMDISLRIEFACGANPAELIEARLSAWISSTSNVKLLKAI
jgi:hypothetical protein